MEALNRLVGRTVPWLTLGMVGVTFAIVVLRYVFGRSWVWPQELVTYLHALTFLLAAGWALSRDAHVRVDLFYSRLSPRRQALSDLLGALLLLIPAAGVILYQSIPFVLDAWAVFEGSKDPGGLDAVFLLKSAIPLFCILLILQALVLVNRGLKGLQRP
ncbi:MAG: TRAP transporter small permease subunit [Candidatus Latescibacteria bacterium]|nr:TRAP transporter small permease subunit [Candidatus Latescibacterota bacterium]